MTRPGPVVVNDSDGTTTPRQVSICGQELPIDPTRTVASVALPNGTNLDLFSINPRSPANS